MGLRRKVLQLVARRPGLMTGLIVSSLLLIGFESLGIGLILLILGVDVAGGLLAEQGGLAGARALLAGLSVGERIHWAALVLFAATLSRTALTWVQKDLALRLRVDVTARLQEGLLARMHRLPLWYLQGQRSGGWCSDARYLAQNRAIFGRQ